MRHLLTLLLAAWLALGAGVCVASNPPHPAPAASVAGEGDGGSSGFSPFAVESRTTIVRAESAWWQQLDGADLTMLVLVLAAGYGVVRLLRLVAD